MTLEGLISALICTNHIVSEENEVKKKYSFMIYSTSSVRELVQSEYILFQHRFLDNFKQ